FPAAALAEEQERAVLEKVRWAGVLDPRLRRIAEQHSRSTACAINGTEIEPRLGAVLDVVEDLPAVRPPADTEDQRGVLGILAALGPMDRPTIHTHDADLDTRIGVACFRISCHLQALPGRRLIDDRELPDGRVVETKE